MLQEWCNVYILSIIFFFNKGPIGLPGEVGITGSVGEKVIPFVIILFCIKNSQLTSTLFYVSWLECTHCPGRETRGWRVRDTKHFSVCPHTYSRTSESQRPFGTHRSCLDISHTRDCTNRVPLAPGTSQPGAHRLKWQQPLKEGPAFLHGWSCALAILQPNSGHSSYQTQ